MSIDDAGVLSSIILQGVNVEPATDARPILGRYLVMPPPQRIDNRAGEAWCFEWIVDDHRSYTLSYRVNNTPKIALILGLQADTSAARRQSLESLYTAGHAVGRVVRLHINTTYTQGGVPVERDTLGGAPVLWLSVEHPTLRVMLHEDDLRYYLRLFDADGIELPANTPVNTTLTLHILNARG